MWAPFRFFEFALGMAIGWFLVEGEHVSTALAGPFRTALCLIGGAGIYLIGALGKQGNFLLVSFPIMALGLTLMSLPFLFKSAGRAESSVPGRLLAWIGPMSLAVLIMNKPFRFIDQYLWLKQVTWSLGWWFYIVVIYVPGTVLLAIPLSRALGLTPPGHAALLFAKPAGGAPPIAAAEPVPYQSPPTAQPAQGD